MSYLARVAYVVGVTEIPAAVAAELARLRAGAVRGAHGHLCHPDRELPYWLEGLAPGGARRVAARYPS
jgi:hypothetical protein